MNLFKLLIFALFLSVASVTNAQIVINGMVADSVTLEPLVGTTIKLKKAKSGVTSREQGIFTIVSPSYDTLVFSRIGYKTVEYPFFGIEKDILILMKDQSTTLKEVVVNFYTDEKVVHSTPRVVKPLKLGDAFQSPFTYFSKDEREKRILVRFQEERQRVQTYVDLITRPQFRAEIMDNFSITEAQYYDILMRFNVEKQSAHYLTNELEIRRVVNDFFRQSLGK